MPGSIVEIAEEWSDADRAELPLRGRIDVSNAVEQLGWEPQFSDLRTGMADYIGCLRAFHDDGGPSSARRVDRPITAAPGGGQ